MFKMIGVGLAVLGAGAFGVYLRFIRPWQLRWGATDEEVARAMSGDDVVKQPTFNATRAVTITARPEEIWPWLIQIGVTRAGWYSYDWLDNLGHPSAERIIPEFQHLAVGDVIPLSPDGTQGQWVKAIERNRRMVRGAAARGTGQARAAIAATTRCSAPLSSVESDSERRSVSSGVNA